MWRSHSADVSLTVQPQVHHTAGWATFLQAVLVGRGRWTSRRRLGQGRPRLALLPPWLTRGELEEQTVAMTESRQEGGQRGRTRMWTRAWGSGEGPRPERRRTRMALAGRPQDAEPSPVQSRRVASSCPAPAEGARWCPDRLARASLVRTVGSRGKYSRTRELCPRKRTWQFLPKGHREGFQAYEGARFHVYTQYHNGSAFYARAAVGTLYSKNASGNSSKNIM